MNMINTLIRNSENCRNFRKFVENYRYLFNIYSKFVEIYTKFVEICKKLVDIYIENFMSLRASHLYLVVIMDIVQKS